MTCAAVASAASTSPRENAVVGCRMFDGSRREGVRRMHQRRPGLQRLERIGERLEDLVVDPYLRGGLAGMELRVGDDHRQEVGHAAGELAFGDEDRLIGIVQALSAEARHVGGGEHADDARHGRGFLDVDLQDARARMLGQHHRAVQHPGHAQIVDEVLVAERLLGPAQARDRMTDAVTTSRFRSPLDSRSGRPEQRRRARTPDSESGRTARRSRGAGGARCARHWSPHDSCLTSRLNGVDDSSVPGAAAEVPVECLGDRRAVVCLALLHERGRANDDPRDAEATLDAPFEDEGVAHLLANVFRQPLERGRPRDPRSAQAFSDTRVPVSRRSSRGSSRTHPPGHIRSWPRRCRTPRAEPRAGACRARRRRWSLSRSG